MKQQILTEAWELYHSQGCMVKLGMCIRQVCSQMATKEHSILSKLDGEPALAYFNQHYSDKYELQFNLEGM